jgi:hypothetical protein
MKEADRSCGKDCQTLYRDDEVGEERLNIWYNGKKNGSTRDNVSVLLSD